MLQEYYGSRKAIRTYLLTGKFVNIRLPPLARLPEGQRKAIPKPQPRPNNAKRKARYHDRLARKRGFEQAAQAQAEVGSSKRHKGEPCVSASSRDDPGSHWWGNHWWKNREDRDAWKLGESKSWENRCRGGGRDHWGENRCRDDDRSRSRGREQIRAALSVARPKFEAKKRPRPSRAPDSDWAPDPPRLRSRAPESAPRLRSRSPAPDGLRLRPRSPAPDGAGRPAPEAPWKISARLRSRADRRPERRGADRPARRGAT